MKKNDSNSEKQLSLTKEKQLSNILKAAEACFIEQGIALTTMKDIAERGEIYRRTLYNYFQSKEEIAFAIHQGYNKNGLQFSVAEKGTGYDKLAKLIDFLFDNLEVLLPEIRYAIQYEFFVHHLDQNEYLIKEGINVNLIHTLKTVLELGKKDGSMVLPEADMEMTVYSLLQAIIGYLQRVIHRQEVFEAEANFVQEDWDIIMKIILRGLKA